MSQVLIGIIGVILFIGLALAGAMFLGPRFQESATNSKASASLQAVAQIAQAANLFEMQEGFTPGNLTALTSRSYLKAVPVNPVSNSDLPMLADLLNSDGQHDHALMRIGASSDASSRKICDAINKQATGYSGATPTVAPTGATSDGVSGCYDNTFGTFYVWARI